MVNNMYPIATDPKKNAKVCARNVRVSTKHSIEIGRFIKGMKLEKAKKELSEVVKKNRAIPYTKFNTNLGHKTGMGPGRYPIIATKKYIELLESLQKNAEYNGLDTGNIIISNAYATKGSAYYRPRRSRFRGQQVKSTNISLIATEGIKND